MSAPIGGFLQTQGTQPIPKWTLAQIAAAVPASRGVFTFPLPYGTRAWRVTDATDGVGDYLWYAGYSYWRNMNFHVNDTVIKIFLGSKDATGPMLFHLNKTTEAITKIGPIFPVGSIWRNWPGEGWYWNHQNRDWLYISDQTHWYRYNVTNGTQQLMIDAVGMWGADREVVQMHSATDDNQHVFTVRVGSTNAVLGAGYYQESPSKIYFYNVPTMNECMIDQSGRWTLIMENNGGIRFYDNFTGTLAYQQGGSALGSLGHADAGWGYFVGYSSPTSQSLNAQAIVVWTMNPSLLGPTVHVSYSPASCPRCYAALNHLSMPRSNFTDPANEIVMGSNVDTNPEQNEIMAVRMNGSGGGQQLLVAPVMSDLNAPGGGSSYAKYPKGNCDLTGEYFLWTTNLGGTRLDAFIVQVPQALLLNPPAIAPPTNVTITMGG